MIYCTRMKNNKIMANKKIWQYFFISKVFYMLFALLVYSKFTTLGDTWAYLSGGHYDISNFLWDSSSFMGVTGTTLASLFGQILANIPYMLLSYCGIYYSVSRLILSKKELMILLFGFLSLPSFGVWTSICSKESIGVFFMGILAGYIIDLYYKRRTKMKLIEFFALYIGIIFKAQYIAVVESVIIFIYLVRKGRFAYRGIILLSLLYVGSIFALVNTFYDEINQVAMIIPYHFNPDALSTRENTLILEYGDVFYNAPYGMFIGFWGPTFQEVLNKPEQSIAFIESGIIIFAFIIFLFRIFLRSLQCRKVDVLLAFILLTSMILILFVHFPFGFMNPGSALRYRENFYAFFVVLVFLVDTTYLKHYFKQNQNKELYS